MSKPSQELLRRAREHLRQTGYLYADMDKNPDIVAQFAKQIVREAAKIAGNSDVHYGSVHVTLGTDIAQTILRKFGLKE